MNRRFALIQALVSLVALAAVVWWASKQEAPHIPTGGDAIAWIVASVGLYVLATLVRAERWHAILAHTGVDAKRVDCYALTTVGYMGNNVLPARAGEAFRVVLLSPRCNASKRTVHQLDRGRARPRRDRAARDLRRHRLRGAPDRGRAAHEPPAARDGDRHPARPRAAPRRSGCCASHHVFERIRDWLRPLADSPRALVSRWGLVLLAGTVVLWTIEGSVYWTVGARARDRHQHRRRALPGRAHELRRRAARGARLDRDVRRGRRLGPPPARRDRLGRRVLRAS